MLPLIMAACGAAGAVAGALTTHAAKEKDRQAVKRYEKVNAELINSRDKLQKQYYELSDRSKKQINDLNLKLAESEMEKDLVYLALSLYHELMALREDIDINPSFEVLVEFHKAIIITNYVLKQLDKHLVPVSQDYFSRTLNSIDERDNLSKEQLFSFMAVLMNPQQDTVTSILGEVQNEMFSQQHKTVVSSAETTTSLQRFAFEVITLDERGQEIKRQSSQAQYFTEDLGNGVTLDMVSLPGGSFIMGSPEEESGRKSEKPQHQVTVKPFFIAKYQVTQAQWNAIASLPKVNHVLNPNPSHFKGDNHPVEKVSWEDAVEFCGRLSKQTGKKYRLPTEAEWEYAVRAGTITPFHFGETITEYLANYDARYIYANKPSGEYRKKTAPVGVTVHSPSNKAREILDMAIVYMPRPNAIAMSIN
ncbi:MAG: formylglycine-generating enzyme family protein [Xenococcaceae cyanobacterium MO_167.B27]|nr:formylglycine-generating enzyme family protein [Xenococcaceae cyanobacterium MO_167.B27]